VRLTLAVGLLKGAQMDDVVRDATALGAAAILPIDTAHVAVAAAGRRSAAARDRWRRVAVAAAKQCGRAVVPAVDAVVDLAAALDSAAARGDLHVWCAEPSTGAGPDRLSELPTPRGATVWIGPEGGWSIDEAAALRAHGAVPIAVGPRTLRARTMPAVVLSALWTRWGW
jgi:16S rRNA (uracil1498-N3)-methyltransferase